MMYIYYKDKKIGKLSCKDRKYLVMLSYKDKAVYGSNKSVEQALSQAIHCGANHCRIQRAAINKWFIPDGYFCDVVNECKEKALIKIGKIENFFYTLMFKKENIHFKSY